MPLRQKRGYSPYCSSAYGSFGIFGSYARGEETEKSDIDVLVRFHPGATLLDLMGLLIFLEEKLGIGVDVVPHDTIRKELKDRIMKEVVSM